jgi:hypothetical protein
MLQRTPLCCKRNFDSCSVCFLQEQQALHYELHKNIALQRRVTLGQAENIQTLKDKNAELNKQLADAQGLVSDLSCYQFTFRL